MVIRNELRRNNRDDDNRKKDIAIKTVVMLLLSFIIFVFAAVAWFAMNKNTTASGMGVSVDGDHFYLRVSEQSSTAYRAVYDQLFGLADSEYTNGSLADNYYRTLDGHSSIRWTLEQAETSAEDSIYSVGLNPGSSGSLSFEIVPLVDGNLAIDFDFGIRGFSAEYYTEAEIADDPSLDPSIPKSMTEITQTGSATQDQKNALKFINGHILYFTGESNGIYSGYIENNVYHFSTTSASKNTPIPVTIYWIWVNTIDQVILKSTDGGNTPIIGDDSSDRTTVLDFIRANRNNIFYNLSEDITNLDYSAFKNNTTLRTNMENTYNSADQIIGTNLEYVLFEMKAELGSAVTPTPTPGT